jgi:Spy/CpxP family protein refolding chaperone
MPAGAPRFPSRLVPPFMAVVVLVVVAAAGIASGVALDRVMMARPSSWLAAPATGGGQRVSTRFARELNLSADQRTRIDSILAHQMTAADALRQEYQPRVRAIMTDTRAAVDSVLTPAQRDRLRAMSRPGAPATGYR